MEENGLAPLASFKKETRSPPIQKVVKKFEIFPAPSYKTHKKISPLPTEKKYLWVGGVYTMEDKDTNTDYQKVVWGPKVGNCRNYSWYHFFLLEICILYFLYREFSSLT